jgi:hypothetical protein
LGGVSFAHRQGDRSLVGTASWRTFVAKISRGKGLLSIFEVMQTGDC